MKGLPKAEKGKKANKAKREEERGTLVARLNIPNILLSVPLSSMILPSLFGNVFSFPPSADLSSDHGSSSLDSLLSVEGALVKKSFAEKEKEEGTFSYEIGNRSHS